MTNEPADEFTESTKQMIRERMSETIFEPRPEEPEEAPDLASIIDSIVDTIDAAVANVMAGEWNTTEFFFHIGAFVTSLTKDEE